MCSVFRHRSSPSPRPASQQLSPCRGRLTVRGERRRIAVTRQTSTRRAAQLQHSRAGGASLPASGGRHWCTCAVPRTGGEGRGARTAGQRQHHAGHAGVQVRRTSTRRAWAREQRPARLRSQQPPQAQPQGRQHSPRERGHGRFGIHCPHRCTHRTECR